MGPQALGSRRSSSQTPPSLRALVLGAWCKKAEEDVPRSLGSLEEKSARGLLVLREPRKACVSSLQLKGIMQGTVVITKWEKLLHFLLQSPLHDSNCQAILASSAPEERPGCVQGGEVL